MRSFAKVGEGLDIQPLVTELACYPELWGEQTARTGAATPHSESADIWLRYRDPDAYFGQYGNDMSAFCDEHESIWLAPSKTLPAGRALAERVSAIFGRELGGVLLTRLPPGGKIAPHIDEGWHAAVHDKFYIPIKISPGAKFCWDDGVIEGVDGDVWWFRNDVTHWVENDSDQERISMIVCLKRAS